LQVNLLFSSPDSVSKAIIEHVSDKEIQMHEAAPTVTILAYYVAKILGFSKVVYSGLDLAIVDNRLYADDTPFKFVSDNKIELKAFNETTFQPRITKIKSADGKEVYTREDYLLFIKQFESILAEASGGPEIISTSTKGAFINGMKYKSFDEIVKDAEVIDLNLKVLIKNAYKESESKWNIL
jgi:hypothetical protein